MVVSAAISFPATRTRHCNMRTPVSRIRSTATVAAIAAVHAICPAIGAASPSSEATPATGWDCDPVAWRAEGSALVAVGSGFALAPVAKGMTAEISARVTPVSTECPEYASIGLSVFDDLDHHWRLSVLKTTEAKGSRHVFEFKRQDGGDWTDGEGLDTVVNSRPGDWKWGEALDMSLHLSPTGLVGVVRDAATGRELYRRQYAVRGGGKDPGLGRPAVFASGDLRGRVENVSFSVSGEVPDVWREFPKYRPVGPETGVYGAATGFFHVENIDGTDWAIDPAGRGVILAGTDWCNPRGSFDQKLGYRPYERFVKKTYGTLDNWAEETAERLASWGFTFLPCGGDERLYYKNLAHANAADRLYFSHRLCLGTADPNWRITEYRRSPCTALPDVFHPDFAAACQWWARQRCAPLRDDPWLVGYFIDNELAWWGEVNENKAGGVFDAVMKKPESHPAKKALRDYLASIGESAGKVSGEAKLGFLRLVAERYFSVTTDAIRRADPNHMVLGCRFAGGPSGVHPVVMEAAGKYCDIVSFNHYPWADLDRNVVLNSKSSPTPVLELYRDAHAAAKKPLLLTEWSFPALDTGRPCTYGAGQRFRTQAERVQATELYAKTLLSLPFFVGYSYFRWLDQPAAGISKYFPENTNYGLVSEEGVPYRGLVEMFARVQGDALRWRSAPPPAERPAPPAATTSERDRYFAEAAAAKAAAESAPAPVAVVRNDDGSWWMSNSLVRVGGRVGGRFMADEIAYGDEPPKGRWGALLQGREDGIPYWVDVSRVTDVTIERDAGTGIASVTIRAEGGSTDGVAGGAAPDGLRFAFTHRLSLAPGRKDVLAEILSLENLGARPIDVTVLFMRPFAVEPKPSEFRTVPNLWKAPVEGWWQLSDGSRWGVSSYDPGVMKASLWRNDGETAQHPDVRCMAGAPFELAPGATYAPPVPIGALIKVER